MVSDAHLEDSAYRRMQRLEMVVHAWGDEKGGYELLVDWTWEVCICVSCVNLANVK